MPSATGSGASDAPSSSSAASALQVALYWPNLVGYLRIALLLAAAATRELQPALCLQLCVVNFLLDGVDGWLARTLHQTSAFGAVLDVLIDNAMRGLLWVWAFPGLGGLAMVMLETTVFTATHKHGGAAWKDGGGGCFRNAPPWVKTLMAGGLRTPQGAFLVAGLMGCPLWCWARTVFPGTPFASSAVGAFFILGRLASAAVELWILSRFFGGLLESDTGIPPTASAPAAAVAADPNSSGPAGAAATGPLKA